MIGKYAFTAAALLQLASKVNGQIVLGENATTITEWSDIAENANMTAHVTFTGRDVSSSYPSEEQDDWQYHLSLLAGYGEHSLVASTITLSGPDGEVEFDDSWQLCVYVLSVKDSSSSGYGSVNGSCAGAVAPECLEDIHRYARENYAQGCPSFATEGSCLRDIEEGVDAQSVTIDANNADRWISENATFYRRSYGSTNDDEEENETLILASSTPQLVLTVFGPAEGDSESEIFTEATCVLPDSITEGSFDPNAEEEGAASAFASFAGWTALTGAAIAYQLL